MVGMIAPYRMQGSCCIETRRRRRDHHEESRQSRWNKIGRIIQARSELAEVKVPLVAVADHRVQRVNRFVGHRQRDAAEEKIKERRHDAIAGTLSQRLQTRTQHFILIQIDGFSPNDMGKILTGGRDVSCKQRRFHQLDRIQQSARSQCGGGECGATNK